MAASKPTDIQRRMIEAAAEIMGEPVPSDHDRAFLARQLVQATLPHSDPGNVPIWKRTNGNLTLRVQPRYDDAKERHLHPYGTIPRLLLFWATTEAVRTGSRILHPGNTASDFMRKLGLNTDNGGVGSKRSDARRLRDQMLRLFRARISFEIAQGAKETGSLDWIDMQVAHAGRTWWDYREPNQGSLFNGSIELGEPFYRAITAAPVPVDMRALRGLRRSPLALDLYAWATYRAFTTTQADKPAFVPWPALAAQVGGDYGRLDNFVAAAKRTLKRIQVVYPALRLGDADGGIIVKPAAPAVPATPPRRRRKPVDAASC